MKKFVLLIPILLLLALLGCQNGKTQSAVSDSMATYDYNAMYRDSFDILLNRLDTKPYTIADTLYTEMYIALKTCGHDSLHLSKESCEIVLDRVDKLMRIDTIFENRIKYLDAKMIVLRMLKDDDAFMATEYQYWNLYPENSLERLSSLGCHFLVLQQMDSAKYYFDRTIILTNQLLSSEDTEKRMSAITNKLMALIYEKRESEGKDFLMKQIENETDEESVEYLTSLSQNFEFYMRELWNNIYHFRNR